MIDRDNPLESFEVKMHGVIVDEVNKIAHVRITVKVLITPIDFIGIDNSQPHRDRVLFAANQILNN